MFHHLRQRRIKSLLTLSSISRYSIPRKYFSSSSNPNEEEVPNLFDRSEEFLSRHIGPSKEDVKKMLDSLPNYNTLDELLKDTIPADIYTETELNIPQKAEPHALKELRDMMNKNIVNKSFIGNGYHGTITPPVILRNLLENPAWYTSYTPYQAEISQGRLEMLLNFQTMICDLTGLEIANSSLLDEATAAAEAMTCALALNKNKHANVFLASNTVHPQTLAVLSTRANQVGIELKILDINSFDFSNDDVFGILVQYPTTNGNIENYEEISKLANKNKAKVCVAADLLSLCLLKPPGEWGADICFGSAQRFGVPMGLGGPHAAFFAGKKELLRKMPGRIIGVSIDSQNNPALRMALQTREQHIRKDKATSNICTAQALLANMAASYALYHGKHGLKKIALRIHILAKIFAIGITRLGLIAKNEYYFDNIHVDLDGKSNAMDYIKLAEKHGINLRHVNKNNLYVNFDETHTLKDVDELLTIFAEVNKANKDFTTWGLAKEIPHQLEYNEFKRTSAILTHPKFELYHSETEMMRYLYQLQLKDLSLATAMIPLGSCTMKLNSVSEMIPVTWDTVGNIHPFAPKHQWKGYQEMFDQLNDYLSQITGFDAISLQPNAGSQGEYSGLLTIQAYHKANGDTNRNICLYPVSAHGTNPASAAMAGLKRVAIKCDQNGNIDIDDLTEKVEKYSADLSSLMITYPSTHGVFESNIKDICKLIHDHGGQVYMDGANMNAQVGLCSPGEIGADVCHLNLHKTFCIPHGGGGPGMGPIGVAKHLKPFLPSHPYLLSTNKKDQSLGAIAAAPYSSASILVITWMYLRMMGGSGLKYATQIAILNANYMANRLASHYDILYTGDHGNCAHEFIIDINPLKKLCGIKDEDIAKRLMDYNFHAPTMSFPVAGTLMIEPTESESLYELDRFCDAMISIRQEIQQVIDQQVDATNNVLTNAPHTHQMIISDSWDYPYSREQAAYPLKYLRNNKFWPSVARINNAHGDRNPMCSCPIVDPNLDEAA